MLCRKDFSPRYLLGEIAEMAASGRGGKLCKNSRNRNLIREYQILRKRGDATRTRGGPLLYRDPPPPCRQYLANIPTVSAHHSHSLEYSNKSNGLAVSSVSCGNAVATTLLSIVLVLASIHSSSLIGLSEIM